MKSSFTSKQKKTLSWACGLLLLGGILFVRFCPRTLSPDECGETYRYFAHQKGVRATYVKDKHINDTLNVDALLLEATSQQGWELLVKVFDIPPLTQEERATMQRQKDYTWSRLIPKDYPKIPKDNAPEKTVLEKTVADQTCPSMPRQEDLTEDNNCLSISYKSKKIVIFIAHEQSELKAILLHNLNINKKESVL